MGSSRMEVSSISHALGQSTDSIDSQLRQKRKKCTKCRKLPIWTNELHGLAQLIKARTWYERAFWFFVIGVCLFCALWFSKVLFSDYIEEQTVTLNTFKEMDRIQYPNLVICPKQADSLQYDKLREDMNKYLHSVYDTEFYDILNFVVAGSGVHGMENHTKKWTPNYIDHLYNQVKLWRSNRSWEEFFLFVFDTNGYKCEDLFETCVYGYSQIPCCEIFKPIYVLKRGRCFRLDEFYQRDPGDLGKLQILMNDLPSNYVHINGTQPQLVLYLSTNHGDVYLSPRLYMNKDTWNEVRYQLKQIQMLPERSQQCSNSVENMGVPRCATNVWLQEQLIRPFNCTFYPFYGNRTGNVNICDVNLVIQNYKWIMGSHVSTTNCFPACQRYDVREQKFSSTPGQSVTKISTPYMIQIQFDELRLEIYEEIEYTSVPGFISELGGQVMLYLGVSLNTVIQLSLLIVHWCQRQCRRIKGHQ